LFAGKTCFLKYRTLNRHW